MITQCPHPHWRELLVWLNEHEMETTPEKLLVEARTRPGAGYGLFALKPISHGVPLFTVPSSALLNIRTLSQLYPVSRPSLTAFQLISIHLLLHRPTLTLTSPDPVFGPYISILPNHFEAHPLTWLWKQQSGLLSGSDAGNRLLADLPPHVMQDLKKLLVRFYADWAISQQYLQEKWDNLPNSRRGELSSSVLRINHGDAEMDYLWAWLNVNTRCIYHRLKISRSDPDNLTLCPILDFANHTTQSIHATPRPSDAEIWNTSPRRRLGDEITLIAPVEAVTQSDDELYLKYGAHANRTLFVEYGFVNQVSAEILSCGIVRGEVDVQAVVEPLFEGRGKLGAWMKKQLNDEGYWGDWTLHSFPAPAHPSYRLITALRLYNLLPQSTDDVPLTPDDVLEPWRDAFLGKREYMSQDNERSWRETLLQICERVAENARLHLSRQSSYKDHVENAWENKMKESIRILWDEEVYVTTAVAESIRQGVQF